MNIEQNIENLERHSEEVTVRRRLTDSQQSIIETDCNALRVVAGPGSGKTTTMVHKIEDLLNTVEPKNIVAFTFTEKAADELNQRVKLKIQESELECDGLSDMYIGTIHGFCLYIMQDILNKYKNFSILTAIRNRIFVERNFNEIGIGRISKLSGTGHLEIYKNTNIFLEMMSMLQENEIHMDLVPTEIQEALENYKRVLFNNRYFDFTSIMKVAYDELTNNETLREYVRENIKYIIVDEYQDVNMLQEKIIREIHNLGAKIITVGDLDQNIYTWRGSDVKNFLNFDERYENTETKTLVENFRSTNGVVDVANECIKNNKERLEDIYIVPKNENYCTGDIIYDEFEESTEEAEFIADRIQELHSDLSVPYREMAVLLRVNKMANDIVDVLEARGIPYVIEGVNRLFDTKEVKASINIIKYVCGLVTKAELLGSWISVHDSMEVSKIEDAINYLDEIDLTASKLYDSQFIQNVYLTAIEKMDIIPEEGKETPEIERICYNLGKFSQVIDDYETINYRTVPDRRFNKFCIFLDRTAPSYYPEGHLENNYIKVDGVRIMTIHQSKGLEFAAVFVPGLSNNLLPHSKRGGLGLWHFLPKEAVVNHERYTEKDIESERRLFYVALTRSKRFLVLTRAKYSTMTKKISPFLSEIKNCYKVLHYRDGIYENSTPWVETPHNESELLSVSFSTLADYKECPYRFKISNLYGFKQKVNSAVGYGNVMHAIANDININLLNTGNVDDIDIDALVDEHFHLPYVDSGILYENMKRKCKASTLHYLEEMKKDRAIVEYVEKKIEVPISENVILKGRIDLAKKLNLNSNTEEVYIVDLKTESEKKKKNQRDEMNLITDSRRMQLLIYAMGYKNLTGKSADFIQIYNLDSVNNQTSPMDTEPIIKRDLDSLTLEIERAAEAISSNSISKSCSKEKCSRCYVSNLCISSREKRYYDITLFEE